MHTVAKSTIEGYDAVGASHYSSVWLEIIKNASKYGVHKVAVDACQTFLAVEFETNQFDSAVELQCESTIYGIALCFKLNPEDIQNAIKFAYFSIERSKILKKNRFAFNSISSIWNSFFSLQNPENCGDYIDFLYDCVNHLFESDFPNSKLLLRQIVNFYIKVILLSNGESQPQQTPTAKKKGSTFDANKQKQMNNNCYINL